jgi:signal transduction histidine kinase/DNA-binding response OmpR family regulator
MIPHLSERALVLAPLGRDAEVAAGMLSEAGIGTRTCAGLPDLVANLAAGAGFAVVTEEALRTADLRPLVAWLDAQPEWSDFPFILLTQRGGGLERNPGAIRLLKTLGNVAFVERPFHPTTLMSLAEAALRGRRRQYEARSRLESLRELNETLESRVAAALAEQKILADVVETTDAFVQVLGPDFCWIAVNRASASHFKRVYGVRPKVGDNLPALLADRPEDLATLKVLWTRALAGDQFTEIRELSDPDDGTRFYEMKFNSLRDRDGNRIGAFQFVYDVTRRLEDQKRLALAEAALRQAQKMEAVGQLTGGVAHDFNNLLMAISGGLALLDRTMDPVRRQRVRDGMRQAVERGAALTRQLLAFSRRRPLEARPLDLALKITGMREILERSLSGDVEVDMQFPGGLWPIKADSGELELAILNMCVNARDAMPGGGTISISARNVPDGFGKVSGKAVVLEIADAGHGMSEEVRARVFEPFYTTKEVGKGSGLGLAQVYAFVSQSGGDVAIDSTPGVGTRITLVFPRSPKMPDREEIARAAPAPENGDRVNGEGERHGHVLLVEDDREVAALTSEMLDAIGYDVTHVTTPAAALGALANGRTFDCVFSDVMMPGGMSGVDLAREIRRRRPEMPIMLATGYVEAARDASAEGLEVLAKPYQIEALERSLRELLVSRSKVH